MKLTNNLLFATIFFIMGLIVSLMTEWYLGVALLALGCYCLGLALLKDGE